MSLLFRDIILQYIDEALDLDDLERFGDYVWSVVSNENLAQTQIVDAIKELHTEILQALEMEAVPQNKIKLKAALRNFEVDFSDYLIDRETDFLPSQLN
ncbi:hypothetical protein BH09BAC5_BH09BAC5_14050 [soil metagenome]